MALNSIIALDAMGGDFGPSEIVPAALSILKKHSGLNLILVGKEDVVLEELKKHKAVGHERLQVLHAPEVVEMYEAPSHALRNKKQSSMRRAIEQVREGNAAACVSAGNTGALMATSRYVLKMLPGMDRPAICTILPGTHGHTHVLDLGANVDSSSEQLFQFAIMGSQLTSAVENKENPTVALLNVGAEDIKGNDRVKQAATLLEESHLNYIGFVEGTDLYTGNVDVIVCDGFVGNIALKASEGLAEFLRYHATKQFKSSIYSKFAAIIAMPVLKALKRKIDPKNYNGASLLGLRGIVIKSHGGADRISFATAIEEAIIEVEKNVPEKINATLEQLLIDRPDL
ncbi:MAG TPA: phosphate acyltransferase PlsX [Thiotrichaceae bacterium]|jgi:glycerol-3-phosphate acyltransferase PlsX|nr:phosphate acyltransferase PlsX [Thiotrichaceae bacterium]HIM08583.1 phosphate acyltransferase PlsX [Gammaproteobacteria bacterium]